MSHGERELTREDVPKLRPEPPAPQPRGAGAHAWAGLRARDVLGLQRGAGNQAVARAVTQLRRRQIQRFTDEDMQKVTVSSKLPADQVQVMLEVGEATGLSAQVMEAATSPLNLNPDGLYTMLGSFRAIVKDKKTPTTGETSNPSTAAPPRGAAGFVRELLYGLQHMRQGRFVQYGAMRPDDLHAALLGAGLTTQAEMIKENSKSVPLGQHLGGDVVVWGSGKPEEEFVPETVQHKVVDGAKESAVADELRNAIHQLSGRNKELSVKGTRRTADIVVLAANELAKAQPEKFIDLIERRLSEEVGGTALAALVDRVRISAVTCQVEYDVKSGKPTIVKFEDEQSGESPQKTLDAKTPREWNESAINRPESLLPKPKVVEQKVAKTSFGEVTKRVDEIESAKSFDALNRSEATLALKQLEQIKKEWLDAKLEPFTRRKKELGEERERWVLQQASTKTEDQIANRKTWNEVNKERVKQADDDIKQIETTILKTPDDDARLLARLNAVILKHKELVKNIEKYETAATDRNRWVAQTSNGDKSEETRLKLEKQWDEEHLDRVPDVKMNQKYAAMTKDSSERDRLERQRKAELRKPLENHAKEVCGPLLDAVRTAHPTSEPVLLASLIEVLDKARHDAGVQPLCVQLADQVTRAHKYATGDTPAIDSGSLTKFIQTLSTHREYVNLQGDLAEITQATRMAESPARSDKVVIGHEGYDKPVTPKQKPQEVDVSFTEKGGEKDILHLQEVAFDLATLELKLLHKDKTSQREGYERVIKAQGSEREVRMTYVVHNAGPEDLPTILTNTAPGNLGDDISGLVKTGDQGAMKTVLVQRGYYLSLGGKVYAPSDL